MEGADEEERRLFQRAGREILAGWLLQTGMFVSHIFRTAMRGEGGNAVDEQTHHRKFEGNVPPSPRHPSRSSRSPGSSANAIPVGEKYASPCGSDKKGQVLDQYSKELLQEDALRQKKSKEKEYRSRRRLVEEELVAKPDPGSREARIEKRRAETTYMREREASPDHFQGDLMGGGDDIKARIAQKRERIRKQRAQMARGYEQSKTEYACKESAKMQAFRDMVAAGNFTHL